MRFFTPDWHEADLDDVETDEVFQAYEQYLEAIWPRLHPSVRVLGGELPLNDALIRRIVHDPASRELRLELRCGDEETGFFDLDLTYLNAIVDHSDVIRFAEAARDAETELLYHELDVAGGEDDGEVADEVEGLEEGTYVHRLLFWPYRECEVLFDALAVRVAPRRTRSVPPFGDRFVEAG
jgi:hypothetical protein